MVVLLLLLLLWLLLSTTAVAASGFFASLSIVAGSVLLPSLLSLPVLLGLRLLELQILLLPLFESVATADGTTVNGFVIFADVAVGTFAAAVHLNAGIC